MKTIREFDVRITQVDTVPMPEGAEILSIAESVSWGLPLRLWATVDSEAPLVSRILYVVATGSPCDLKASHFIGSVQQGRMMLHVFDGGEVAYTT